MVRVSTYEPLGWDIMTTAQNSSHGWVPSDAEFASRLALVRNKLGWNAKEAALACGLPAQSWRNWETGLHPRDYAKVCQAIAARTGVSVEWLALGPIRSRGEQVSAITPEYPSVTREYLDEIGTFQAA